MNREWETGGNQHALVFTGSTCSSSKISEKISRLAPWQVGLVNLSSPLGIVLLKVSGRLMNRWGKSHLMLQNLGIAIDTSVVAALIFTHSHTGTPTLMRGFRQSWDYAASTILFCFVVLLCCFLFRPYEPHEDNRSKETWE